MGEGVRADALRVFVDCQTFRCDRRYFRTEIRFVNWVQEPQDAQVHVIMTSQGLGGGGEEWILDFIGREDVEGVDDRLTFRSDRTDTEEEELRGITDVLSVGLARYVTRLGLGEGLRVVRSQGSPTPERPPGLQGPVDDPWDFWVFEVDVDGSFRGEERESAWDVGISLSADRITRAWKFETDVFGNARRREVELEDSVFVDESDSWNIRSLLVHSVAERWSVGTDVSASSSTFSNRDFQGALRVAVEYSFLPYEEATRRRLTALWVVGPRFVNYRERTVFGKLEETIYEQALLLELDFRQPWGEAGLFGRASHFLDDPERNRLSLGGGLELRVFRGLSWEVSGSVERPRDQVFLPAGDIPDEEVLVRRRRLASDLDYRISTGVSISFGSIFNNVVNNRFN